jgi:hypothetical protein
MASQRSWHILMKTSIIPLNDVNAARCAQQMSRWLIAHHRATVAGQDDLRPATLLLEPMAQ